MDVLASAMMAGQGGVIMMAAVGSNSAAVIALDDV